MSFYHTRDQIRDRSKDVTRRLGWRSLKPGDRFYAVEKGMGLKKGEKVVRLALCECVSTRREPLSAITPEDVVREGFPGMSCEEFIDMFLRINPKMKRYQRVTRIEFKYIENYQGRWAA
jgi:hypothetical protein